MKKLLKPLLFTFGGIAAGFAYYYFIGCHSGSCPIQSNPYISSMYGGLIGLTLSISFTSKKPSENQEHE